MVSKTEISCSRIKEVRLGRSTVQKGSAFPPLRLNSLRLRLILKA